MAEPLISIIIPVRNEADLLKNCLASISGLDYPRDRVEVIVADGMSSDHTAEVARQFEARIIQNEKRTVAPGRNKAFSFSSGEFIAFTDADCVVDRNWLKNAVKYFSAGDVACVGGPNLTPPEEGVFGRAVGYVIGHSLFTAGSVHATVLDDVRQVVSIPGCNAIYRRDALDRVMPSDESLLTCDDTELNQRLADLGYRLLYTPDVFVWHYRRPNPRRLWKQVYRYAVGRLQFGKRDRRVLNGIHILTGLTLPLGIITMIISPVLFFFLMLTYVWFLIMFMIKALIQTKSLRVSLLVPAVVTIITTGWSAGFMRELLFPYGNVSGE